MTHLGNVVIGISLQLNGDSTAQPSCQGLASMSSQLYVDGVCRQASLPILLHHLVAQGGAGGPVGVEDGHLKVHRLGGLGLGVLWEGGGAVGDQLNV